MPVVEKITVEGLREFQKALKAIDATLPRQLRETNRRAAERVAVRVRASFESRPEVAHEVAPTVKALAQQKSAAVKLGGPKAPMAMGDEFGSLTHKQFPGWRGSAGDAGYSLFPTLRAMRDALVEQYADDLDALMRRAFPT